MSRFHTILLILSLFALTTNAQDDFRPGYIVTTDGDTLVGKIKHSGENLALWESCQFQLQDNIFVKSYYPGDIESYRFFDGRYYVSKILKGQKVFLEFLVKGKIDLYRLKDQEGDHYYLENDTSGVMEITYQEKVQTIESKQYLYQSAKHRALYSYYMQDAPELQTRIARMGEPEQNTLIKLVSDYHNIVCKDNACVIYLKKKEPIDINLEFVLGIAQYNTKYINKKYALQDGILAYISLPSISDYIFLRTGIMYSTVEELNTNNIMYKIPIQFVHFSSKGTFRPKVGYGVNMYPSFHDVSFALMGGMNIKLDKSLELGIEYDVDFCHTNKYTQVGLDLLSQSIQMGLYYKF